MVAAGFFASGGVPFVERLPSAVATFACFAALLTALTVVAVFAAVIGLTCDAAAARACIAILSLIDMPI
jgi:hypothetical protein